MAQLRSAATLVKDRSSDAREIIRWYEQAISNAAPPTGLKYQPQLIGPTWEWNPRTGWAMPEATLGWEWLAWTGMWLQWKRGPWQYTPEQARFILHYAAIDTVLGQPIYASGALQRLKGWGKDPVAASVIPLAMCGPVHFDYWDGDRPVGREDPNAWVEVVAVSQDQTQNTMSLLPSMISPAAVREYGFQTGKLSAWAMGDTRRCRAVTASPKALEGGRPTFVIRNETQNWNDSNGGHEMAGVIDGNVTKRDEDTPARILDLLNAYRPGEDSVAERMRDAWEGTQGNLESDNESERPKFVDFGLLYDSIEAPPEAPMTLEEAPEVIRAVRGDSVWLSIKSILKSIANPLNPPSESRRKWYNQITGAEDSWQTPQTWDPLTRPDIVVDPGDEIVMFLDCSKSDDATGLVGCRITDGHLFVLGLWQKPPGKRGEGWLAPREKVDATVTEAFETYNVVGFFGDPSHALADETQDRYWDGLFDQWHRRYRHKLRVWARRGQERGHSVMFDMALRINQDAFVDAVAVTESEIDARTFTHDGDARLRKHILNARRTPTKAGMSIAKEHRESRKKIDLAVCAVGARMVRRMYLNANAKRGGRVW